MVAGSLIRVEVALLTASATAGPKKQICWSISAL